MVGLAFRFDLGRYHGSAWGTNVNEASIDWPPSSWRILRALASVGMTDATLAGHRAALERVIGTLARAPHPRFVLPRTTSSHTRHYMPPGGKGKTSLVIDAFRVVDRDDEVVIWWDTELVGEEREALTAAVACLGYLGRSESVCSARLAAADEAPETFDAIPIDGEDDNLDWVALGQRAELMNVDPGEEDPLAVLTTSVTDLRKQRRLAPPGTLRVPYAIRRREDWGSTVRRATVPMPTIAHLRLGHAGRPSLTEVVTLSHVFRAALQRRFDPERTGRRSPVFSGHDGQGPRTDQHQHAHYLALPGSDDRRIAHLIVWAPEGLGPDEVRVIAGLNQLRMRDAPAPIRLALVGLGDSTTMVLPQLLGNETPTWHSLTPFVPARHTKRRAGRVVDGPEGQLRRELVWRGLPEPDHIDVRPWAGVDFVRTRPGTSRRSAPPALRVELRFSETPPTQPIALGRLSHFGLGLFAPAL